MYPDPRPELEDAVVGLIGESHGSPSRLEDYKRLLAALIMNGRVAETGEATSRRQGYSGSRISSFRPPLISCVSCVISSKSKRCSAASRYGPGEEIRGKRLPRGAFSLLREAVLSGNFARGAAPQLTGHQERQARSVLTALLDRKVLISDGLRGDVRLGIPADVVERWFPSLYQPVHASAPTFDQDRREVEAGHNPPHYL